MDLTQLRGQIDEIDAQLVRLFCERMEIVRDVAEYKRQNHLPVLHSNREQQVLEQAAKLAGPELAPSIRVLFTTMMDLSKTRQHLQLAPEQTVLSDRISIALTSSRQLPSQPVIACQGVEGAYSSIACRQMFPGSNPRFYETFEDVFRCVNDGRCDIGILPIENSTAGSVNSVYDLMRRYRFHIVKGLKLGIRHSLLANPGANIEEITDLYSHEQGIQQCAQFLSRYPHIKVHVYSNTAASAKMVRESGNPHFAAIASNACAKLYGLHVLQENIQDAQSNYTRFIAISNKMIVTPDAQKISVALTLPHKAGALYQLITEFSMLRLNLTKLESRPLPDTDFEFLFYFDFEGSLENPDVVSLMNRLDAQCDYFALLGNYREEKC